MKLKIIKLDKVKSTNDVAIKYITENKISPKIIFSENQTQGRGTRGKKWISKSGNFFATIYFKNDHSRICVCVCVCVCVCLCVYTCVYM